MSFQQFCITVNTIAVSELGRHGTSGHSCAASEDQYVDQENRGATKAPLAGSVFIPPTLISTTFTSSVIKN